MGKHDVRVLTTLSPNVLSPNPVLCSRGPCSSPPFAPPPPPPPPTTPIIPKTTTTRRRHGDGSCDVGTEGYYGLHNHDYSGDRGGYAPFDSDTGERGRWSGVLPTPALTSVEPLEAESSGGMEVVLTGHNLSNTAGLTCSFGGALTPAVWFSNSHIRCPTPRHPPARVLLQVSLDGGVTLSLSHLQFAFRAEPSVSSVSPVHGPAHGGVLVTVTGANFRRSPAGLASTGYGIVCRFGSKVVPAAEFLSANAVVCVAPPATEAGGIGTSGGLAAPAVYVEVGSGGGE